MAVSSRKEIRNHCMKITDTQGSAMESLVNDFINESLNEVNDPGWAFRKEFQHNWSFLRRKTSFSTAASTTDYLLPRDVDRVALLRQETTPVKLRQVTDRRFYEADAKRDETGNPYWYRMWEVSGVSTKLAVADTVDIVSSSTSDTGNTSLNVTVWGYVDGIIRTETYRLTGTTTVSGSLTFDADDIFVSMQTDTTGTVTVSENSGGTTLITLSPTERTPIVKVVSLYPIPDSAITMYVEYFTRIRELSNDSDTPQFDPKWHHIIVKGTLTKIYQHLGKEIEKGSMLGMYKSSIRGMVKSDMAVDDYIPRLKRHFPIMDIIPVYRSTDDVS